MKALFIKDWKLLKNQGKMFGRCACFLWVVGCNGQQHGTVYSWILSVFIRTFLPSVQSAMTNTSMV